MKAFKSAMAAVALATLSMGAMSVGSASEAEAGWHRRHHGWGPHWGHHWGHHRPRCFWVRVCHGHMHGYRCHGYWTWVRRCHWR